MIHKTPLVVCRAAYYNPATGKLYKEGETIKLPKLGKTMQTIADEGADTYYSGSLADDIVLDLKEKGLYVNVIKLGKTMQTIADEGADTYYSGSLADDIVLDLQDKGLFVMD